MRNYRTRTQLNSSWITSFILVLSVCFPRSVNAKDPMEADGLARRHELEEQLASDKFMVKYSAAMALGKMGFVDELAVPGLVACMKDEVDTYRSYAAYGLGEFGPAAKAAMPALIDAVNKDCPCVRMRAAESIWKISGQVDVPVSALVAVLANVNRDQADDAVIRAESAIALGKMGSAAVKAVPALVVALGDESAGVRGSASQSLAVIGRHDIHTLEVLAELLQDETVTRTIRRGAAQSLSYVGRLSEPPLPRSVANRLIAAIEKRDDKIICAFVSIAIGKFREADAVPALVAQLENEDIFVRIASTTALGEIGMPAIPAMRELGRLQHDSDPRVRSAATSALRRIQGDIPQ